MYVCMYVSLIETSVELPHCHTHCFTVQRSAQKADISCFFLHGSKNFSRPEYTHLIRDTMSVNASLRSKAHFVNSNLFCVY